MIQLADVQIFLEIVGAGSFTAAARALKMPKSSVARQLARLEQQVGCSLLDRSTRVVTLTEQGQTFLPHARQLLDHGIEAQRVVNRNGRESGGLLRIATTGLFGRRFIVPHLPAFQLRHPGIRIALWLGLERHEIGVAPEEVDIAIRLRTAASPQIGNQKLGEIDFCMVAAPAYLERCGTPATPDDLAGHAMIELGPYGKHHRLMLSSADKSAAITYTPSLQIDDPEAVRLAALSGCGIAVLPGFLVRDDIASGSLHKLLPDWQQAPIPVHVLYRTHVAPPLRVRAYVDYLVETLGSTQPWTQ